VAITVEEVRQRLQLEWRLIVFMFIHGGGWVLGDFPTHERFVRDQVSESGAAAVLGVGVAGSADPVPCRVPAGCRARRQLPAASTGWAAGKAAGSWGDVFQWREIESIGDRVALGEAGRFPVAFASCEPSYADS